MRTPPRQLLVIAGEASGDGLAAAVLDALGPSWSAFGVGGPQLRARGMDVLVDASSIAVVGITEVLGSVPRILSAMASTYAAAVSRQPDVALLVDLPDFNFRLGPLLHRLGIPVVYLGAPQAWAWRAGRTRSMARWIDVLACLFPFEPAFFEARGVPSVFVGHPAAHRPSSLVPDDRRRTIALLPGSRHSEIRRHLPIIADVATRLAHSHPARRLVLSVADTLHRDELAAGLGSAAVLVELQSGGAWQSLQEADLAIAASGTVVTECMLAGVVPVVFYRLAPTTYAIARRLVRVQHISMPNILAGEGLVPELVQDQASAEGLHAAACALLDDDTARASLRARLRALGASLHGPSVPGAVVAERIRRLAEGERA